MSRLNRDRYFQALAAELGGPRAARERLLAELRDHLDDAIADEVTVGCAPDDADHIALTRLGAPTDISAPWSILVRRRRRETRKRAGVIALAAATACALAVVQHASGHRQPSTTCTTTVSTTNPACPQPQHSSNQR
jgi:HAAS